MKPLDLIPIILLLVYLHMAVLADVALITKPIYLDDNLYFEVVLPKEIAYTYKIRPAKDFGILFNQSYTHIELVPTLPLHGCSTITNTIYVNDNIAFIERGGCSFLTKTINAEKAGALAVVICDNEQENDKMIDMIQDETGRTAGIPALFLLGKDGYMIRDTLERLDIQSALINVPVNMTGVPFTHMKQPPWTLW